MTVPAGRRLNLFDVMVVVAMAAAGLASLRGVSPDVFSTGPGRASYLLSIRNDLLGPLLPCGLAWTLAVLLLRLGHPRPSRRRLARQPGVVACIASISTAAAGALALLSVIVARHYTRGAPIALTDRFMPRFLEATAPYMGYGVLVAWLVLILNGTWRPEPSWVDRLGRVMGAFWIATIPVFLWPAGRLIL